MRHIRQPDGSSLCGQIAVAVVTGLPLDEVIERGFAGHRGKTNTRRVKQALRRFGVECGDKLERTRRTDVAIARLSYAPRPSWSRKRREYVERRPSTGHWVVVDEGRVWDGIFGDSRGDAEWPDGAKLTSYLPLTSATTVV
jgi:hypothetical protein